MSAAQKPSCYLEFINHHGVELTALAAAQATASELSRIKFCPHNLHGMPRREHELEVRKRVRNKVRAMLFDRVLDRRRTRYIPLAGYQLLNILPTEGNPWRWEFAEPGDPAEAVLEHVSHGRWRAFDPYAAEREAARIGGYNFAAKWRVDRRKAEIEAERLAEVQKQIEQERRSQVVRLAGSVAEAQRLEAQREAEALEALLRIAEASGTPLVAEQPGRLVPLSPERIRAEAVELFPASEVEVKDTREWHEKPEHLEKLKADIAASIAKSREFRDRSQQQY